MAKDYYMSHKEWHTYNKDRKMFDSLKYNRYYCKCGHSVIISNSQERAFCDWCKHWIYKDEEEQQKYDEIMKEREKNLESYKFRKELFKRL